ncbi:PAS/PAC sensor signal transduction histidine kinase [Methanohalophilus mahii DSM 5219]|uniref:histidine kinase n=1 Tax=Methanohalophilus mahii (strain ATCC 35705 / DSM 5219 / SLP) TaxID=547558 RepID=D5E9M4_METMS|nr:PAS/PAC sensor signal transduction histidine kinase [Methanohalophilus mahii DSM 5219]
MKRGVIVGKIDKSKQNPTDMYSTLVKKSNDGIIIIQDEAIIFANPKFREIIGYKPEELKGMDFKNIFPPENINMISERYHRRLKKDPDIPERYETEMLSKKGSRVPVEISASYIEHNNRPADMAIIRDITERRDAEKRLEQYTKSLEKNYHIKELFGDIVSHDLKNPAGIIKGYSQLLADREEGAEKKKIALTINRNINRILELIENASVFVKLDTLTDIKFERSDLSMMLKKVADEYKEEIQEKEIDLKINDSGEYPANIHKSIHEAFSNLLSNAIKYGPEKGQITIDIIKDNGMWKILFIDEGEGVPDDKKELIFERFERAGSSVSIKGTGLGLAIVKKIMEIHGGQTGVEDREDRKGSVFWVTIPRA